MIYVFSYSNTLEQLLCLRRSEDSFGESLGHSLACLPIGRYVLLAIHLITLVERATQMKNPYYLISQSLIEF